MPSKAYVPDFFQKRKGTLHLKLIAKFQHAKKINDYSIDLYGSVLIDTKSSDFNCFYSSRTFQICMLKLS